MNERLTSLVAALKAAPAASDSMLTTALDLVSIVLVVLGLLFFIGSAVGLVRFPDFYTRLHAAGKGDTLSTFLLLSGIAVHMLQHVSLVTVLVAIKILAIGIFIMLTSPTSTHALMNAGYEDGVKPVLADEQDPTVLPPQIPEEDSE